MSTPTTIMEFLERIGEVAQAKYNEYPIHTNDGRTINGDMLNSAFQDLAVLIGNLLAEKQDTEPGKGLSTNDFTTALFNKLNGIAPGAEANVIDTVNVNGSPLTPEGKAVNVSVPTSLEQLAGDATHRTVTDQQIAAWITKTVDDLVNYYKKSETYSQTEVNNLIGAIQKFHFEIYAALPASGQGNVLYLIGPTGSGADQYEEYVFANGAFVKIGDTSIDLSGYVTSQALNSALANYYTKLEVDRKIALFDLSNAADAIENPTSAQDVEDFWEEEGLVYGDLSNYGGGASRIKYYDDTYYRAPLSSLPRELLNKVAQIMSWFTDGPEFLFNSAYLACLYIREEANNETEYYTTGDYRCRVMMFIFIDNDPQWSGYVPFIFDISTKMGGMAVTNLYSTGITEFLSDNTYYLITSPVGNTTFSLPNILQDGLVHNIILRFTAGTGNNVTFSVTAPSAATISYFENFAIEDGKTYEINCLFNGRNWTIAYAVIA